MKDTFVCFCSYMDQNLYCLKYGSYQSWHPKPFLSKEVMTDHRDDEKWDYPDKLHAGSYSKHIAKQKKCKTYVQGQEV